MLLKDEVELLRRIPLFAHMAPARLKLLAFASERISFAPGELMGRQGDPGDAVYVILTGSAEVVIELEDGSERKVAELGESAVIGEVAVLADVPRTATMRALCELSVLKIGRDEFLNLLREFPDIAMEVMRILAQRLSWALGELS